MRIISGRRLTGRTTKLIELTAEAHKNGEVAYIACHSSNEAIRLDNQARALGYNIRFPITYDELLHTKGSRATRVFIDNAEYLLGTMILTPIGAITIGNVEEISVEDEKPEKIILRVIVGKDAKFRVVDQNDREFEHAVYPGRAGDTTPEMSIDLEMGYFSISQAYATVSFRVPVEVENAE